MAVMVSVPARRFPFWCGKCAIVLGGASWLAKVELWSSRELNS